MLQQAYEPRVSTIRSHGCCPVFKLMLWVSLSSFEFLIELIDSALTASSSEQHAIERPEDLTDSLTRKHENLSRSLADKCLKRIQFVSIDRWDLFMR